MDKMIDEDGKENDVNMKDKTTSNVKEYLTHVHIENSAPNNTSTHSFHGTLYGYDNSFSMEKFCDNFEIQIKKMEKEEVEFDMIGIEAPIANAFRRIMLSEVPTMCVDKVVVNNNTSVLPDEVIAHRIGLIPFKIDPSLFRTKDRMKFEMRQSLLDFEKEKPPSEDYKPVATLKCNEDVLFRLKVECKRSPKNPKFLENDRIYSRHLEWIPFGNQKDTFKDGIRPVHEDILICQLSPGQVIDMELYVEKGIGKTHAKWSPVCTASYRLMPVVKIEEEINGDEAEIMKKKCPKKVFDIEDGELYVKDVRRCSFCKECIREESELKIKLAKKKNHFIFTVESSGVYDASSIFREAIGVFYNKCKKKLEELKKVLSKTEERKNILY